MIVDGIALEQTVLGHALNSSDCYEMFVNDVQWEFFQADNHRIIAFCLKQMSVIGIKNPDEDSFQIVINAFPGKERDYGGAQYIRSLREAFIVPTSNYKQFIDNLRLRYVKNKIGTQYANELVKLSNDPTSKPEALKVVLNGIEGMIDSIAIDDYDFKDMIQLADDYQQELDDRVTRKFYSTGLESLDRVLVEGFAPKTISVLAGFTGMAKSTVAINMAHRIAVGGTRAGLFSMESTDVSMLDKIVSTLTQIPLVRLKKETKTLTVDEKNAIAQALEDIKRLPLIINDKASMTIDGMLYQLKMAIKKKQKPDVVFIDLFGKIEDVDTGDNLASRIQRECKRMRVLGKELGIHFCLVVQIGRQGFGKVSRGGRIKRPVLIDIKNSNAYAEEADLVFLLHRNKYYVPEIDDDILEVEVAKQRGGESGLRVFFEMFAETSTLMETEKRPHDVNQQ